MQTKFILQYTDSDSSYVNEPGMAGYYNTYKTRVEEFNSEDEMMKRFQAIRESYSGFRMFISQEVFFMPNKYRINYIDKNLHSYTKGPEQKVFECEAENEKEAKLKFNKHCNPWNTILTIEKINPL